MVLSKADLILEVLDARYVEDTRNPEIEEKVRRAGKKLLYVLNKSDLIGREEAEKLKSHLRPSVFISSTKNFGTILLKQKIMELSRGEKVVVGIVGYPNVGKSSLINALAGREAARTSASSGFTKGLQRVRVGNKILLLDTPGVFPNKEKDELKHGATGAIDFAKLKDPEAVALKLIEEQEELICRAYGVEGEDAEEILEKIGKKYGKLSAGGKVNMEVAARMILRSWQSGKMRRNSA